MGYSIQEIANAIGAEFVGDGQLRVHEVHAPDRAGVDDLALASDKKYADALARSAAQAAIIWDGADWQSFGLTAAIIVPKSRYVMAGVTSVFNKPRALASGVHPTAIIDPAAALGKNVSVGPFVIIGPDVHIGDGARIFSHTTIAAGSVIGTNATIAEGVRIGPNCKIGNNFIAQPNCVIGCDGFSYVTPNPGALEEAKASGSITQTYDQQAFARINSLGGVVIDDDVEVGASSTIDAGTIEPTRIGKGTKIDNLVQIAHNVQIGQHCLFCAQAGVAGSTKIGNYVIFGGKVGCADNLTIGNNVIAGMALIISDIDDGKVLMGIPAVERSKYRSMYRAYMRLPRFFANQRDK